MKLTWFGHSAFRLDLEESHVLIDPFLKGNPRFEGQDFNAAIAGITHIALTHGHSDHIGNAVEIAQALDIPVLGNADLCSWLEGQGVAKVDPGNTGGTLRHSDFSMTFVRADHSSATQDDQGNSHALGNCNGLIFKPASGPTVYHMGDTDIFSDMALINELHAPDVGIVPVGDRFTMGGAVAGLACRRYFDFKTIIPCHYGTFGLLDPNADAFVEALGEQSERAAVLEPGGRLAL